MYCKGKPLQRPASYFDSYSTDQKKPNGERLTERVLFPFHMRSRSCSVSVPFLFANAFPVRFLLISTVPVLAFGHFDISSLNMLKSCRETFSADYMKI